MRGVSGCVGIRLGVWFELYLVEGTVLAVASWCFFFFLNLFFFFLSN